MSDQAAVRKPSLDEEQKLEMSFDPNTIEHLGVKMYSNLPNALAELIANSYDADATKVTIKLSDRDGEKEVRVIDNGIGMNFSEVNSNFLRIGRNRRQYGSQETSKGRKVTGKKGLGKLALFGIGERIDIQTTKNGDAEEILFTLDWAEIKTPRERQTYEPGFKFIAKKNIQNHGTSITLKNLKRKSNFDPIGLAESLSKLFNSYDSQFEVWLEYEDKKIKIDQGLKYDSIEKQFDWQLPELSQTVDGLYEYKGQIRGEILSTEKPIKPTLRGITLFARGRMINSPEYFGISESSHGFSYLTGWLNVDFIDDWDEDVISTDRQSLNWDLPKTIALKNYLQRIVREVMAQWRKKRNEKRIKSVEQKTDIKIADWYSKLPGGIRQGMEKIINTVEEKSELAEDDYRSVVVELHAMVPEYPFYHWRHLHPEIHAASETYYQAEDYYQAFAEAVKTYLNKTKDKSKHPGMADQSMMGSVFGCGLGKKLKVAGKYKKPNGSDFDSSTLDNVEEGQKYLSMGVVSGCRNPVAHEVIADLRTSGLFTEKDCLDALGLLSHLFRRLDDAP